jgi:hypothetical protein
MASVHNYGGINRADVERLKTEIAKEGITLPATDVGLIEFKGVRLSFDYAEDTNTLKIGVEKKPFYVTEAQIWSILDEAIEPFTAP